VAVRSAGILLYRDRSGSIEVFLAHMGGPFWARKDGAAWSIPKGEIEDGDEELGTALREFAEEIGTAAPELDYVRLGEFRQSSAKTVIVFAAEADFEPGEIVSNTFEIEWPPRSGRTQAFPEIDDARWFGLDVATEKLVAGQRPVLERLLEKLSGA
jgi:predicted NUDIX family NTP pyrophosphohydrolase